LIKEIRLNHHIKCFATRTIVQGMLSAATGSAGIQINAVNFEEETKVSKLGQKIKEGRGFDSTKKNEVLIGKSWPK